MSCAAAGSISTFKARARLRSQPGKAAVPTGQIGIHTPWRSMARTHGASLAFLSSLSVMIKHSTSGGGCVAISSNCAAPLSGLPLGIRSSNSRRSANKDSACVA